MTITVRDIRAAMEHWAPPALCYPWDKAGLHTGRPDQPVDGVVACLTVNERVVQAALKAGANMIVSHHPLVWEPLTHLRKDSPHHALCLRVAAGGLACYSAHTNLDMAENGVNATLARALGLKELSPLAAAPHANEQVKVATFVPEAHLAGVRDAMAAAGAGVIGDYSHCGFSTPGTGSFKPGEAADPWSGRKGVVNEEPELRFEMLAPKPLLPRVLEALFQAHPYEEVAYDVIPLQNRDVRYGLGLCGTLPVAQSLADFAGLVRRALKTNHVRMVGLPRRRVRRVGVVAGGGGGYAPEAPEGIDVFVTGDVKYDHAREAAARGLAVIDAGHGPSERIIVPVMASYLRKTFNKLSVKSYVEPNYFRAVTE